MRVSFSCLGSSAQFLPGSGKWDAEAAPGESVADVLKRLGIPLELFMFAVVRGEKVDLSYPVQSGDEVLLVSPPAGG